MQFHINSSLVKLQGRRMQTLIDLINDMSQNVNFFRLDRPIALCPDFRIDTHLTNDKAVLDYYGSRRNPYGPNQVYYGELQSNGAGSRTFAIVHYPDDATVDEIRDCFVDSLNDDGNNAYAVNRS